MNIEQALAALGNTPEEVYAKLKELGITGKKMDTCECPVARYLNQVVPHYKDRISVGISSAGDSVETEVDVPVVVQTFITRFDSGHFIDLQDNT